MIVRKRLFRNSASTNLNDCPWALFIGKQYFNGNCIHLNWIGRSVSIIGICSITHVCRLLVPLEYFFNYIFIRNLLLIFGQSVFLGKLYISSIFSLKFVNLCNMVTYILLFFIILRTLDVFPFITFLSYFHYINTLTNVRESPNIFFCPCFRVLFYFTDD